MHAPGTWCPFATTPCIPRFSWCWQSIMGSKSVLMCQVPPPPDICACESLASTHTRRRRDLYAIWEQGPDRAPECVGVGVLRLPLVRH